MRNKLVVPTVCGTNPGPTSTLMFQAYVDTNFRGRSLVLALNSNQTNFLTLIAENVYHEEQVEGHLRSDPQLSRHDSGQTTKWNSLGRTFAVLSVFSHLSISGSLRGGKAFRNNPNILQNVLLITMNVWLGVVVSGTDNPPRAGLIIRRLA